MNEEGGRCVDGNMCRAFVWHGLGIGVGYFDTLGLGLGLGWVRRARIGWV